jgi:hypothetical protein
MGPAASGFRLLFDAAGFDAAWVLAPGVVALALAALCAALAARARRREGRSTPQLLGPAAALLAVGAVWWTLGGIGAWRAGVGRLATGTANFVEGAVASSLAGAGGGLVEFRVQGLRFKKAPDWFLAPQHATRWPAPVLADGQRVRLWFFDDDLFRVEVAER